MVWRIDFLLVTFAILYGIMPVGMKLSVFSVLFHDVIYKKFERLVDALSSNHTEWSKRLPTNCLSVFDPFVGLVLKGLSYFFQ